MPGYTKLSLTLQPGTNIKFTVSVEETIQSGKVFVTRHGVTLVTREERLPSAYFKHLADCEEHTKRILGTINQYYAISEAPGPKFDPRRYSPRQYLAMIERERPEDLQRAIDAIRHR